MPLILDQIRNVFLYQINIIENWIQSHVKANTNQSLKKETPYHDLRPLSQCPILLALSSMKIWNLRMVEMNCNDK